MIGERELRHDLSKTKDILDLQIYDIVVGILLLVCWEDFGITGQLVMSIVGRTRKFVI